MPGTVSRRCRWVDTNVISELRKRDRCNANVRGWFDSCGPSEIYLSALTVGELRTGHNIAYGDSRRRDPVEPRCPLVIRGARRRFLRCACRQLGQPNPTALEVLRRLASHRVSVLSWIGVGFRNTLPVCLDRQPTHRLRRSEAFQRLTVEVGQESTLGSIEITGLTKTYGDRVAVENLDLRVESGEVFGLLGPNGAGKSTTLGILTGLLVPDAGAVNIAEKGEPTQAEVRRCLGLAPQALALYEDLTGRENLQFFGRLQGLRRSLLADRVGDALSFVGLTDRATDRVSTYSGGMKRRLNLAAALLHDPEILLLDEPTVGVDPQSRNHLFDNIEELKSQGRTIVYSTHYMEEAERLCDRVAILDHGELLALGTVPGLIRDFGGSSWLSITTATGTIQRIETEDPAATLAGWNSTQQGEIRSLEMERPSLEGVFLHLTGRSLRDG